MFLDLFLEGLGVVLVGLLIGRYVGRVLRRRKAS